MKQKINLNQHSVGSVTKIENMGRFRPFRCPVFFFVFLFTSLHVTLNVFIGIMTFKTCCVLSFLFFFFFSSFLFTSLLFSSLLFSSLSSFLFSFFLFSSLF